MPPFVFYCPYNYNTKQNIVNRYYYNKKPPFRTVLNSGASKVLRRLSPSRLATLRVLAPLPRIKKNTLSGVKTLVRAKGLEPSTSTLARLRSSQLSYARDVPP